MSTKLSADIWQFLWRYLTLSPRNTIILMVTISFAGIIPSIDAIFIKHIIDTIEVLDKPEQLVNLMDVMFIWAIGYAAWWEFINANSRLYDYVYLRLIPVIQSQVIEDLFDYIQYHSHNFFKKNFAGNIANRIGDAAKSIEYVIALAFENILHKSFTIISSLLAMFYVDTIFGLVLLAWLIFFIALNILFYPNITRYSKQMSASRATTLGKVVDAISNINSIRIFSRHNFEKSYLRETLNENITTSRDLQWFMFKLRYIEGFGCSVLIFVMIYYLIELRAQSLVTVGDFALIISLSVTVADNVWSLMQEVGDFFEHLGICNQSLSLVQPYEIKDKEGAKKLKVNAGKIEFKKVTFNYEYNDNLFDNTSIVIPGKQKVGLVGFSGSGKSTFVNLITRLFDIDSGEILVDGQNIASVTKESLRSQIGFIPQEPILFHRTIKENIQYGKLDATDGQIIQAAKDAFIYDIIMGQPHGLDTICDEGGANFSGGQKQRIAIARAILKNAPILILDEATSALDSVTENLIQASLNKLMEDKTVLVVAHRLSTLVAMDRILVFDKGHIVEDGTHEELLELGGIYHKLWRSQVGGFLADQNQSLTDDEDSE